MIKINFMRKYLLFSLFSFLLVGCAQQAKQSLVYYVAMENLLLPRSIGNGIMYDSIVYRGKEKQLSFCYSFEDGEDREAKEERIKNYDDKDYMWFGILDELIRSGASSESVLIEASMAGLDLSYSYYNKKGEDIGQYVFSKNQYNLSPDDLEEVFDSLQNAYSQKVQTELPAEIDEYTICDSLLLCPKKLVYCYTVHDWSVEKDSVESTFAIVKNNVMSSDFEGARNFEAVYNYGWIYEYVYYMDGKLLASYTIQKEDIENHIFVTEEEEE